MNNSWNAGGDRGRGRGQRFRGRPPSQDHSSASTASRNKDSSHDLNRAPVNSSYHNPKFEEAKKKMKEGIERFIGDNMELESSSSEDELNNSEIIQKTFGNYSVDGTGTLQNARDLLQELLTSGAAVCLICLESIKRNDQVWSCQNCFCMLHVSCIQKWAKDSMYHLHSTSEEGNEVNKKECTWCCPKCRYDYKAEETPTQYFCFCGKMENPPLDPWIVPHSCGSICGKNLKPFCGHQCLLLCHPGPCPPCPKTVQVSCFCKRSNPAMKRCSNKEWSCGKPCSKLLSCKQHNCVEPCHGGDCPPCKLKSEQNCLCGNERKLRPCDSPKWQCEKVCCKPLECGNHLCLVVCHSGKCGACPKSGPRPCPCQKKVMWLPCTEEVVPCGDTCDKMLDCELHKCSQRCHFGDCGACLQMRTMKCRCGQRVKSVPCCRKFICDTKCKRKRDCRKHNCNRKCCIGDCPPCEAPCTRTLNCGVHKCQSRCHAGPCFPCRETVDIKCFCGQSKITVPCGRKKSEVPPPRCKADCKLPADCHHEERHRHRCHFGACPPCKKVCGKVHPCGHSCPARCHTAVLTKVEPKKKREGPWDLVNSYRLELVEKPCPPCVVPVSMPCLDGHVVQEFPCHECRPWSCGRACGRSLTCGNHVCELQCHDAGDAADPKEQSKQCTPCERMCEKERPKGCTHNCHRLCHPGECYPCKEFVKMKCHCQINQLYIVCSEWTNASAEKQDELISCKNSCPKQLSCGHRCPKICHKGACPDRTVCKKRVTIRCKCKRLKKEVPCISLAKNECLIACDQECESILQQKKAEEDAKMEAERQERERQQQLELEEFQRKMEGKKKKKKHRELETNDSSWLKKHYLLILCCIVVIAIIFAVSRTMF